MEHVYHHAFELLYCSVLYFWFFFPVCSCVFDSICQRPCFCVLNVDLFSSFTHLEVKGPTSPLHLLHNHQHEWFSILIEFLCTYRWGLILWVLPLLRTSRRELQLSEVIFSACHLESLCPVPYQGQWSDAFIMQTRGMFLPLGTHQDRAMLRQLQHCISITCHITRLDSLLA